MTFGSKKWEHLDPTMRRLIGPLHDGFTGLIPLIDTDADAFTEYSAASKLPKGPERDGAMQAGIKTAIDVPLEVMRCADSLWPLVLEMAECGNMSSASDLEVGARLLEVGIWGAYRNVVINMGEVTDMAWADQTMAEADTIVNRAAEQSEKTLAAIARRAAK